MNHHPNEHFDIPAAGLPSEQLPAPSADRSAREPFWGYEDVLIFAALALPSLLFAALLSQAVFLILGLAPPKAVKVLIPQFLGYGFLFAALYLLLRLKYGRPFWTSLGFVIPRHGMTASLMYGPVVAFSIAILGALIRTPQIDMPIRELLSDNVSILMMGIFATTLGPLCEELAFRGFLQPLLQRTFGGVAGIVLAALPFAFLHGPQYGWSWRHILLLSLAATAFGWTRYKTGSTAAAAVMHATYNLTFFIAFLLQGKDISA